MADSLRFFAVQPAMAMRSARSPSDQMEWVRKNGAPPSSRDVGTEPFDAKAVEERATLAWLGLLGDPLLGHRLHSRWRLRIRGMCLFDNAEGVGPALSGRRQEETRFRKGLP